MRRNIRKLEKILDEKQKKSVFFIILLMLFGGILESVSISLVFPVITAIMDDAGWRSPWYAQLLCNFFNISDKKIYLEILFVLLITIFVCKNLFMLFEYYLQFTFIAKSRYRMQHMLMHRFLHKPYSFFLSASSGEIVRILTSDTVDAYQMLISYMQGCTEGIVCVVLSITIFVISPSIAWKLALALIFESLVITRVIKPIMQRIGNRKRGSNGAANKWLLQSINGIKSIKVAHNEDFFENQYIKNARIVVDADRKSQTLANMPKLFVESFTVTVIFLMMFFMVISGDDLAGIMPQMSAFVMAAVRLLPSINRINTLVNNIPYFEGGLDNIIKVLDEKGEFFIEADRTGNGIDRIKFDTEIVFSHITYRYPEGEKMIFENATFSIKAGESVGIVGASGAGKTTAVDIILGLLLPQNGKVLVDGKQIDTDLPTWLSMLAYIPQNIFLMDDTIKANVVFGSDSADKSDDEVWDALSEAHLDEYVRTLPDGINTRIGEQGIRLSGGQRQRIGIARALYNNPKILFFDEATSALDNETEAAIMESINSLKGRKTMVIIAHRLSTIEKCDVVYRVEAGKVMRVD